jgi:hypothetical protein
MASGKRGQLDWIILCGLCEEGTSGPDNTIFGFLEAGTTGSDNTICGFWEDRTTGLDSIICSFWEEGTTGSDNTICCLKRRQLDWIILPVAFGNIHNKQSINVPFSLVMLCVDRQMAKHKNH